MVFGPEGCGKTAFLRQAVEVLRELGYEVFYLHQLDRVFMAEVDEPDVKSLFLDLVRQTLADEKWSRIALAIFDLVRELLKRRKRRVAVIADDVFQAIGLDKAAAYVKGLLNMIEHPVYDYEKMIVLVTTSEGLSRSEIGKHRWSIIMPMWNMPKEGFRQLYEELPGPKPPFDDVWRLTGGNPGMLSRLYVAGWSRDAVVAQLIREKDLTPGFIARWRNWLKKIVGDPEALWSPDAPEELIKQLVERNLIVYNMYERNQVFWIYTPPERDPELGIGKNVAWQTPLHREAVKRALEETK